MKKTLLSLSFLSLSLSLFAQTYDQKQVALQKEVWDAASPEFKVTSIPEDLNKESAVVIARSFNLKRSVHIKSEISRLFHERVKINDKVALEKYSTLEYQRREVTGFFISRNTKETVVGVKIIKPNGSEIIVPTNEEVLLKNDKNGKNLTGKIAVSGLQTGDILDYYVSYSKSSLMRSGESYQENDNLIMLTNEYPILFYDLKFQFNSKLDVQCVYGNNAPHFTETKDKDDNRIFAITLTNLPKYQTYLWTSPLRQYPYIEIGSEFGMEQTAFGRKRDKTPTAFDSNKSDFESTFNENTHYYFKDPEKQLKDYFDGNKGVKAASKDTLLKVLYDIWKYNTFCTYTADNIKDGIDFNARRANGSYNAMMMTLLLNDLKIENDIALVSSRTSNTLENVFNPDDFTAIVRVKDGGKTYYMCFDDVVTHFNEIPARYQGENAIILYPKRKGITTYSFTEGVDIMPIQPSAENTLSEKLNVSLLPDNMQKLKIERQVRETGDMRHDDQKDLLAYDEIDNYYTNLVKGDDLQKRLRKFPETSRMYDAFQAAFNDSRNNIPKIFTAKIKAQYDQEPEQLSNFKIVNNALENTNPVFEYNSTFVLNNMVKKAGANYIVDAGKLTGGFLTLTDKEKDRKIDVYMNAARTITYTISINIPKGYSVKGLEELVKNSSNKTGSFASTATLNGNVLNIKVTRVYNSNFEKVTDWKSLMAIIDAAAEFNGKQILLEKQG
ncbi:hypothetical protein [Mucilaginibacter jinjuensis]|uniref:DUF3857 domain-containing protein n=1 Tax=Mucilaginibacter jinjuensis TaxID=1176721 RepID=A0ABY7T0U9_9SPHI|nr:hypothetical protein [Mucilaginibacter jinjuensis]WCT10065.1 hypothetical protein PQO05_15130 [Mucilaginibacter jinjuensis]